MPGRGLILGLALLLAWLAAGGKNLQAQGVVVREFEIKAAYLYNFARYVEWPKETAAGGGTTFVIGVLGPDPFGVNLNVIDGKTIQDKKIVVRRFASAKDYQPCHILFVSGLADPGAEEKTESERIKAAVAKTRGAPVLLVGDGEGLAQKGLMIDFYVQSNQIKLEINRTLVSAAGLQISARLLALQVVRIVRARVPRKGPGLPVVRSVKDCASGAFQGPEYHARIS